MEGTTINIDTGGTFTDAFVVRGDCFHAVKTITTPHDLALCFAEVIDRAAQAAGMTVNELLRETVAVRYSTTVAANAMIQRTGPRLGLIAGPGGERLYAPGDDRRAERVFGRLLRQDMVEVLEGPPDGNVVAACRGLLERCARGIVCALAAPADETAVRQQFELHYPRHCLDAVPLLLSHEVESDPDDFRRTATALFNAYVHPDVAAYLYRAEDHLREHDYRRPLLIVRSGGGCARVAKTVAVQTYGSGSAAGLAGAALLARHHDIDVLATFDMGGTSLDVAFLERGEVRVREHGDVEGIEISHPLPDLLVLDAGGGSIAHLDSGELRVGPRSAGAAPGPACFGFGGAEPTVTDADLVLGVLDPERFLGGDIALDPERARQALATLGGDPVKHAADIRATLDTEAGARIAAALRERGLDAGRTVLLACGGAGPMHACGVARVAGISRILSPPFAATFSAFGASSADLEHTYLDAPGEGVAERLQERALRDMRGEGFAPEEVRVEVADVWRHGTKLVRVRATVPLPHLRFRAAEPRPESPVARTYRDVHWPAEGWVATPIYGFPAVTPRHRIDGPAVIEAGDTTYALPRGWHFEIDWCGHAWMRDALTASGS